MKYNDVDDKENSEFHRNEHLRFSTSSYNSQASHQSDNHNDDNDDNNKRYSGGSNYNHNKRMSRTSACSSKRQTTSKQHRNSTTTTTTAETTATSDSSSDNVIALFGCYGVTGHHFLKFALAAGYSVRALIMPGIVLEDVEGNDKLTMVIGTFEEEDKIKRVVKKASYVICMLNDCESTLRDDPEPSNNFSFIQRLVPIMEQCRACRILLYQASSFALDAKGSTPMFSQLVKKMALRKSRRDSLQEQDQIVQYICNNMRSSGHSESSLQFIITRPSDLIWDRPSRKKLAASKSQPGPFPITNTDLAEFSLNALKMEKLYNTCPYVVQDGI